YGGLLKKFRRFDEFSVLCTHGSQVVVRTGKNFRRELAIGVRGLGLLGLWKSWLELNRGSVLHASPRHGFRRLVLIIGARLEQAGDPVGSAAIAVGRALGLVEDMFGVVAKLGFTIALRIRQRFLSFLDPTETTQILTE